MSHFLFAKVDLKRERMIRRRVAPICLFGLTLILCWVRASISHADQQVRYVTAITAGAVHDLEAVGGVFFDKNEQRLYITDAGRNCILAFDSNFELLSAFTGSEALNWPTSLVKDSRGRFFVAQPTEGSVVRIDVVKGEIQPIDFGSVPLERPIYPCNLAIGPFDDLYIVDSANERILIFDVNQKFVDEIKMYGAQGLKDVKVDASGRVYAVSTIDGSVHVYDMNGRQLFRIGRRGNEKGAFRFPVSLAVDQMGLIYVLDQHMNKVLVFSRRGEFLFDFSSLGWRQGELHYPSYIFIDRSDRIFIVDRQNTRISIFE